MSDKTRMGGANPLADDTDLLQSETSFGIDERFDTAGASGSGLTGSTSGFESLTDQGADRANDQGDQEQGERAADKVTSGVDAGMSKAAEGLDRVVESVRSRIDGMEDNQITSAASMAADRIETGAEALRSVNSDELVSQLESMIREKPLESLLVAAGIGFVLSRAL